MSIRPPPARIWRPIHEHRPGIWADFLRKANAGIRTVDESPLLTSWWRTESENRRVGGDEDSQHLLGLAFDLAGRARQSFVRPLRQAGLVVVVERDHIHVQHLRAGEARRHGLFDVVSI